MVFPYIINNSVWPCYTINHVWKGHITVIHQFNFFPKCLVFFTQQLFSKWFLPKCILIPPDKPHSSFKPSLCFVFHFKQQTLSRTPLIFPKCILCFSRHIIQFRCKFLPPWTVEVFTIWPIPRLHSILTSRGYRIHYNICPRLLCAPHYYSYNLCTLTSVGSNDQI